MALSYELISQFAKLVNQDKKTNAETTVYGTIVVDGENKYVQLDGSDQLIPIEDGSTSADANADERVSVLIKNHTATVTGNVSSPAARTGDVKNLEIKVDSFDTVIAKRIQASEAYIKSLLADDATIGELEAAKATITELIAKDAEIADLIAKRATITDLIATKIDAAIVEAEYATIKNLEATNAVVTELDAKKASVERMDAAEANIVELTAEDAKINGTLNAANAKISNLEAEDVKINGTLNAANAKISNLEAEDVKINGTLSAHNAVIANLNSAYASIDFANINMAAVEKLFTKAGIIDHLIVGDTTVTGEWVGVTLHADFIEAGTLKADKLVVKGSDGIFYKLNVEAGGISAEKAPEDKLHGSVIAAKSIVAEQVSVDDLVAFGATIGGFNITDSAIFSGAKGSVNADAIEGVYLDSSGQFAIGNATSFIKYYNDASGSRKLEISADEITFGTGRKSVEEAIDEVAESTRVNTEDLTAYISATTEELENLQGQIDGSITTWFYEYVPTKNNIPASEWTTTDVKNNHLGDLFYDTLTGYCYRWQVQNNEYFWTPIKDTDVVTALENAAKAQSTADNKRRVFVSTPVPPYDIGDLWTQGTTGDLMRCQTAKTSSQTYAAADWVKASKYTDDTAANQAQEDANALKTRVSSAETQILANKDAITLQAGRTTQLDADIQKKLEGYCTIEQADSKIAQSAQNITLSVEQQIKDVEIGGRNLLLNSSMKENLDEWEEVGNILDVRNTVSGGLTVRVDDVSSKQHVATVLAKSNLSSIGDNLLGDYSLDEYCEGDESRCNLIARDEPYVVSSVDPRPDSEDYFIYFEGDYHLTEILGVDLVSVPEVGDKIYCVETNGELYAHFANTVDVMVCGKNLVDVDKMLNVNLTKDENGVYSIYKSSAKGYLFAKPIPPNTPFTLSYKNLEGYNANSNAVISHSIYFADGTTEGGNWVGGNWKSGNAFDSKIVINKSKAITGFNINTYNPSADFYASFTGLQIELGSVETELEEYKEPIVYTVVPNDPTEIESLPSPTVTIISAYSGASLDLTYHPISGFIEKNGKQCLDIKHVAIGESKSVRQDVLGRIDRNSKCMFSGWFMTENLAKGTDGVCALVIRGSDNSIITSLDLSTLTPGQWDHVEFEVDTTASSEDAVACYVEIVTSDITGDLYVCELKLEKGNKVTDWTPAPEDSTRGLENATEEMRNATEELRNSIPTDIVTYAELQLTATDINATVKKVETGEFGQVKVEGKNYVMDHEGFKIEDVNAEDPITTTITNNGMTIYKRDSESEQDQVLTANANGVNAKDLHARTYLIVAGKTRFEKYKSDRIGCFWIGD